VTGSISKSWTMALVYRSRIGGRSSPPFFTTKREGTGLGLPIALKILSAHGGTLEVLETGEKGAAFQVGLPLKRS